MKADDDHTLVTAILTTGDEAAFRTLFRRHSPSLYALALRLLRGFAADADDAVQETWIREAPPLHQPAIQPEDASLRLDLERAIAELPDGYRNVVVLHDIEGYTHEDIGRLLDIDAGTSKSQLFRARRALRAALSIEGENGTHTVHGARP